MMEDSRTGDIVIYALTALACASLALFFLAAPIERVLTLIPDDASYYFVQHAFWDNPPVNDGTYDTLSVTYTSRLYLSESDTLRLAREDEVYRSAPYHDGPYETVLVIWRLGR